MPKCCIKQCRNNTLSKLKKDGVSYFHFPQDEVQRDKWRIIVANERGQDYFKPNDSSVVCSDHFLESDMYYTNKNFRRIKKTSVPSLKVESAINETIIVARNSLTTVPAVSSPSNSDETRSTSPFTSEFQIEHIDLPDTTDKMNAATQTTQDLLLNLYSPKTTLYKRKLNTCRQRLDFKTKQVQNLKKKNKRLLNKNVILKQIIKELKKKEDVPKN